MSAEVRRARFEDAPEIERFIREAYEELAPFKGPDRWRWQFVDNPFRRGAAEAPPVWLAVEAGQVVGQIAVQAADVELGGRLHPAGWIVDVIILPRCRGRGLGHRLHDAVARDNGLLLTLTMAPATRRMAERGGAVTLGPTRQFSRWVRVRPDDVRRFLAQRVEHRPRLARFVRRACGGWKVHHPIAAAVAPWTHAPRRDGRDRTGVRIDETSRFGADVDALWQRARGSYPALCVRDRRFLNWRFVDCPGLRYRLFTASRDGATVGWSVLRRTTHDELRQGVIVDLFAERHDAAAVDALIGHAVECFGDDVASIEGATSLPEVDRLFRSRGFIVSRTLAPTAVAADAGVRGEIERRRNDWLFSKADHDWDQVHLG